MASNEYYDSTGYPSHKAAGSSASMRAELDSVESGFNKLPVMSGNNSKLVGVNSGGTALEAKTAETVKAELSIDNVDNTSDLDKPVSTATQAALDALEDELEAMIAAEIAAIDLSTVAFNDIIGFNATVSANTLTFTQGSCWDSTRTVLLTSSSDLTVVIPSTASALFYLYIVKLVSGGAIAIRAYTTASGVASDSEVAQYRRRAFWNTRSDGSCVPGVLNGDEIFYGGVPDWTTAGRGGGYSQENSGLQVGGTLSHSESGSSETSVLNYIDISSIVPLALVVNIFPISYYWLTAGVNGYSSCGVKDGIGYMSPFAGSAKMIGTSLVSYLGAAYGTTINATIHIKYMKILLT